MCAMTSDNRRRRRRAGEQQQQQQKKQKQKQHSSVVSLIALLIMTLLCVAHLAQGQFFTKSSSKSIPRMGRRSLIENAPEAKAEAFKRTLIDRLVDEYGASLFTNLLESKLQQNSAGNNELSTGELYLRNEQPFDLMIKPSNQATAGNNNNNNLEQVVDSPLSRNERGGGDDQLGRQSYNKQSTKSLAMRAFNADRLLQHLSSGGSPSIGFYERLTDAKEHSNYGD